MSLIFEVKVTPKSSKSKCIIDKENKLKCYLKSVPESGKANSELLEIFQKALGVKKTDIEIIFGATSRLKRIKVNKNITLEYLLEKLGIENQLKI